MSKDFVKVQVGEGVLWPRTAAGGVAPLLLPNGATQDLTDEGTANAVARALGTADATRDEAVEKAAARGRKDRFVAPSGDATGAADTAAIQAALDAIKAAGGMAWVGLAGTATYYINANISIDSDTNCGLRGEGGMATIQWVGAAQNTGTETAATSMISFAGTDHSFGGLCDLFLDANQKANFCVFLTGIVNTNFRISHLHLKLAQLDCILLRNSGTTGVVQAILDRIDAFPATTDFSAKAVCGRYVVNIDQNVNSGIIHLRDCNFDNGVSGVVAIQAQTTYAGWATVLDNVRFEMNAQNIHCVLLNYAAGAPGPVTLHQPKFTDATAGVSNCALVRNTGTSLRPVVTIDGYSGDNIQWLYREAGREALYQASQDGRRLVFNAGGVMYGPSGATYTLDQGDDHGILHNANHSGGAVTFTLPVAAKTPNGYEAIFTAAQAGIVTLTPDAAATIAGKSLGESLASSGTLGDSITLRRMPGSLWVPVSKIGTWS